MTEGGSQPTSAGAEVDHRPEYVPLATRYFYGLGSVSEGIKNVAFNTFLLFYYNHVLGLPGTLSGLAILVAFPLLFKEVNAGFAAGTVALDQVGDELARWALWHWLRVATAVAAFAAFRAWAGSTLGMRISYWPGA